MRRDASARSSKQIDFDPIDESGTALGVPSPPPTPQQGGDPQKGQAGGRSGACEGHHHKSRLLRHVGARQRIGLLFAYESTDKTIENA